MTTTRTIDRLRLGAEQGVAQVLTPAEVLMLLDRLAELEVVEDGAELVRDATRHGVGFDVALSALDVALRGRRVHA